MTSDEFYNYCADISSTGLLYPTTLSGGWTRAVKLSASWDTAQRLTIGSITLGAEYWAILHRVLLVNSIALCLLHEDKTCVSKNKSQRTTGVSSLKAPKRPMLNLPNFSRTNEGVSLGLRRPVLLPLSGSSTMCIRRTVVRKCTRRADLTSAATGDTRARAALGRDDVQFRIAA